MAHFKKNGICEHKLAAMTRVFLSAWSPELCTIFCRWDSEFPNLYAWIDSIEANSVELPPSNENLPNLSYPIGNGTA